MRTNWENHVIINSKAYLISSLFTFQFTARENGYPRHSLCYLPSFSVFDVYTMSADWSAIRRRQTLGEVLSQAPASQIPQPSSVFKKSAAGRASVAPGGMASLGPAPRSSLAPQRFFRSSSGGNVAGEPAGSSLSSSQASSQQDNLRNSRQSYAPQQSFKYIPSNN